MAKPGKSLDALAVKKLQHVTLIDRGLLLISATLAMFGWFVVRLTAGYQHSPVA